MSESLHRSLAAASAAPPAGGAELSQVVIATGFGIAVTIVLAVICLGHRSGRIGLLAWAGRLAERVGPLPGWAMVPATICLVTLLPTLFGLQWDESLHIAQGRDPGPLANPSHYVLLQGIFGAFAAGVIAMAMADERVPASSIAIPGAWRVPLGGALITLGASVALIGFPLDDVWHRLYGQDVTLWGPTHVMMIAGMSIGVLGIIVLVVEGLRAAGPDVTPRSAPLARGSRSLPGGPALERSARRSSGGAWLRRITIAASGLERLVRALAPVLVSVMLPAALLLVVSLLQGEYDFGVSQFRLLMHPMIVMAAAGFALVASRIFFGPGAALRAVAGFLVIRGLIALIVGPILGEPGHLFPLYLVEAGLVELAALRIPERRPLALGLVSGVLIGTVGLAAEWAWSNVFAAPWPAALLPEAAIFGLAMALAGAVIGAWTGAHLRVRDPLRTPALRYGAVIAATALTTMIAYGLHEGGGQPVTGKVTLNEVTPRPNRAVAATIRLDPPDAASDAAWISEIAWQGGGLISEPLKRVVPGVYTTPTPLPVHGSWKSALRLQTGDRLLGIPVFLPRDAAIPVGKTPAPPSFERSFQGEKALLQREAKGAGNGLLAVGTLIVAALCFGLLAISAAMLHRLAVAAPVARVAPAVGSRVTAAAPPPPRHRGPGRVLPRAG